MLFRSSKLKSLALKIKRGSRVNNVVLGLRVDCQSGMTLLAFGPISKIALGESLCPKSEDVFGVASICGIDVIVFGNASILFFKQMDIKRKVDYLVEFRMLDVDGKTELPSMGDPVLPVYIYKRGKFIKTTLAPQYLSVPIPFSAE